MIARRRCRTLRGGLPLLLGAAFFVAAASPLFGQQALADARGAWAPVAANYRTLLNDRNRIQGLFEVAMDSLGVALESNQRSRIDRARAAAQARGIDLMNAEGDLRRTATQLDARGRELLRQLEVREREIVARLAPGGLSNAVANDLRIELEQVRTEISAVETLVGEFAAATAPRPLPTIQPDPRLLPRDYLQRAELFEWRERGYRELMDDTRQRIQNLQAQQSTAQLNLFGPNIIDPAPGGRQGGTPSIGEQIDELRQLLSLLEVRRAEAAELARIARAYAEGRTP